MSRPRAILSAPPAPRSPWQKFYGAVHRLRRSWHHQRAFRLPRPVISIGNLSWGGSGKTPMTAAVAERLRDQGYRVAILSRGYGRKDEKEVRLISDGEGPMLGPLLAGDEPVLLAGMLPGVAVAVGADRAHAGNHLLNRLDKPPDVFILDDGFSHLQLYRDLDLLLFPAADPFAGGRLPPSGKLREPLASSSRADAVLLTGAGADELSHVGDELAHALRPHGFQGPGFGSQTVIHPPRRVLAGNTPGDANPELDRGERLLLVSGIARPEPFAAAVREMGFDIADHLVFADHHAYPASSLEQINQAFQQQGATTVLATAKDRVKLHMRLKLPLAELPLRAEPVEPFWDWLRERLAELKT